MLTMIVRNVSYIPYLPRIIRGTTIAQVLVQINAIFNIGNSEQFIV